MSKRGKIIAVVILLIVAVAAYFLFAKNAGFVVDEDKEAKLANRGGNADSTKLDPADTGYIKEAKIGSTGVYKSSRFV